MAKKSQLRSLNLALCHTGIMVYHSQNHKTLFCFQIKPEIWEKFKTFFFEIKLGVVTFS